MTRAQREGCGSRDRQGRASGSRITGPPARSKEVHSAERSPVNCRVLGGAEKRRRSTLAARKA